MTARIVVARLDQVLHASSRMLPSVIGGLARVQPVF
jgi:hypothetical protein